jgi:hypothetical protein
MSPKYAGRVIGALMLAQVIAMPIVNFVLLAPIDTPPGFFVNAAAHASTIPLAVLIGWIVGALSVAIAIAGWSHFRRHGDAPALWLLALATVGFAMSLIEHTNALTALSVSQAYAKAGALAAERYDAAGIAVMAARHWAHYAHLIVGGVFGLVFYATLWRSALVPRALAIAGIVAVLAFLAAVVPPVFGKPVRFALMAPIGLVELAVIGWLLVRGFAPQRPDA